uniref:Uncharacterized protein n=1 Tax=Parascaris univalens TaxID=6257 RepID=A0A915AA29_PARUN
VLRCQQSHSVWCPENYSAFLRSELLFPLRLIREENASEGAGAGLWSSSKTEDATPLGHPNYDGTEVNMKVIVPLHAN